MPNAGLLALLALAPLGALASTQDPAAPPKEPEAPKAGPSDEEAARQRAFEERMKGRKAAKPRDGWVSSARYGFELRTPKKWTQIGVKAEEEWLAAKFQCDSEFFYTDKELGYTSSHKPEMLVVVFPKEEMEEEKEVSEKETEQGTKLVTITFKNPYKNYDDFLDRTYSGGGFFKAEEKKADVGGVPVIQRLYRAEKLSREGPKFIVVWLYQDEDVEYALQTEVLEGAWPKLQSLIEGTYKTFALVKRDGRITHDGATQDDMVFTFRDLNAGEPKERRSQRMESERSIQEKAVAKLPPEWTHEKKGKVMVLSNADDKWTKRVITHSNNLIAWLEQRFGFIGPEEYVRTPIIRVCRSSEEEASYRRGVDTGGGWGWSGADTELVTSQDDTGWIGREIDWLNRELLDYWFREKNSELMISMPDWLDNGLDEAIKGARMDGAKPEFRQDEWNAEEFREAERTGKLTDPKQLFVMTGEDFNNFKDGGAGFWNRRAECQMLVRFLISEDAKRVRQAKGLIETYMTNLIAVIKEAEAEYAGDLRKKLEEATTTEEEQRRVLDLRAAMQKREKTILERTFERTFGGWTDKDWEAFTKGMRASI